MKKLEITARPLGEIGVHISTVERLSNLGCVCLLTRAMKL